NIMMPFTLTIPATADSGLHRMRVRNVFANSTFSFDACSSYTYGEAHDYMAYVHIPSCPVPSALTAFSPTPNTAELDWTEHGTATQWEIEYGLGGFTLGTGTLNNVTAKPATISGLMPNTVYEYY